jgi:Na+/H+-dicarboxylate symporter
VNKKEAQVEQHSHMSDKKSVYIMIISLFLGLLFGYLDINFIFVASKYLVDVFINLLKFISLPVIFLSICTSINKLFKNGNLSNILVKTVTYTVITTLISAFIAMVVYLLIEPATHVFMGEAGNKTLNISKHLVAMFPSNIVGIFYEHNVIAIVMSAFFIGYSSTIIPKEQKNFIELLFQSLFTIFMKIAAIILSFIPYLMWCFVVLFIKDIKSGFDIDKIFLYMLTIIVVNAIQAIVILPLFLKSKNIPVIKSLKGMLPALTTAFFSKSSAASIPTTMHCIEKNLHVKKSVSSLVVPLCTTINMNACAAFIYITVLFVSQSHGVMFSYTDYVIWIFLATIAAIGNAGVPMGCYFMASAYLSGMDVPIYLMGVILPFYTILDMFETAINVWSDACVTLIINENYKT